MKISACITVNDRPVDVLQQVFDSMRGQDFDEFVVVLDAAPLTVSNFCAEYWRGDPRLIPVVIDRAPGWRSPVKAWNRGYAKVTGDLLYCFSSETVQAPGNLAKARDLLETPRVLFGKAECSCGPQGQEVQWNGTAPGNLLCDAAHPRPLGFIWAAPTFHVKQTGGWDQNFDRGFWYDEADFFCRLWRSGLDFLFTDDISGTHLHHDRPSLTQEGIAANLAYIRSKWGSEDPLRNALRTVCTSPGTTLWIHP